MAKKCKTFWQIWFPLLFTLALLGYIAAYYLLSGGHGGSQYF